jgi:hypothetical protein
MATLMTRYVRGLSKKKPNFLFKIFIDKRTWVAFKLMSDWLPVATEISFYEHIDNTQPNCMFTKH